jgi:hypothetical protein
MIQAISLHPSMETITHVLLETPHPLYLSAADNPRIVQCMPFKLFRKFANSRKSNTTGEQFIRPSSPSPSGEGAGG